MVEFNSYEELVLAIDRHSDLITCPMWCLRDAHGAGKLGKHVVSSISDELQRRGLSHYPAQLPVQQWENARIYRTGTQAAKLIDAVLNLDAKESDETLRAASANDANEKLKKVRELICD